MSRNPNRGDPPPKGALDGLRAVVDGALFILTTPRVWPYAAVPAGMMLLLSCVLWALGVWGAMRMGDWLIGQQAGVWGQVGSWVMTILLGFAALLIALVLGLSLAQPLSGFALEAIVRAREWKLTGTMSPSPSFLASLVLSGKVVLVTLLVGVPTLTLLFVINLIFPPAVVVTVPLKILVCGWLIAWDFCDYPLTARGAGIRVRLQWASRHRRAFTAFGIAWAVLAVVPGIILFLLPMGVAGATWLVVEDEPATSAAAG